VDGTFDTAVGAGFGGVVEQALRTHTTTASDASKLTRGVTFKFKVRDMWLILLEAGVAMFVLVFIVWWTMFAGRKPEGERRSPSSKSSKRGEARQPPSVKD
jgi:hypothetical protein